MRAGHKGAALVLGLMLLASISILAMAAASGASLQNRMAANWEARSSTFAHAAIADSEARSWLASRPPTDRGIGCGPAVVQPFAIHAEGSLPSQPEHLGPSWWASNAISANQHPELGAELIPGGGLPGQVNWIIEEIHCQPAPMEGGKLVAWYRILSRAEGKLPGSVVVTESIVARPWGDELVASEYPGGSGMSGFCRQLDDDTPCGRKAWRQRR